MTTLIGRRCKGSDVRSRAVLIARMLAHCPSAVLYHIKTLFVSFLTDVRPKICHIHNIEDLGGHGDGAHPFPFRTGKLSPFAPMVLLYQVGE